jgi:hypothetical protein
MKTHPYFLGLVLALGLLAASQSTARAFIGISVGIAPPPLPVYVQPACPGDGYAWTPGYWAWDPDEDSYYWVPGSWVLAPEVGLLWTPCWWGWQDGAYCFHNGYWGRDVGFYGGVNYGYGYNGRGFDGGRWRGNHFVANRANNGFNGSRVSFNGGRGGINAVATANERAAGSEHHFGATNAQNAEARSAATNPGQRFSANHGRPAVTSSTRAGSFRSANANAATGVTHQRSNGESAFTGESRTASNSEHLNRTSSGNAFTGENRTASASTSAQRERATQASAAERRTQVASEQRRTTETRTAQVQRTAAVQRQASSQRVSEPRINESHASAPSHTQSFHPSVSHSSGGGGGFAHASASHSGGGGGGFAHASASHSGGGGGGGGHSAGGGGGHGGGGGGGHH